MKYIKKDILGKDREFIFNIIKSINRRKILKVFILLPNQRYLGYIEANSQILTKKRPMGTSNNSVA